MKIIIGHLYSDILNLYGETGNIKAITDVLKNSNIDYEVKNYTLDQKWDIKDCNIIYIGNGTDENLKLVIKDIKTHQKEIKQYIKNNKLLIATGNAYNLFGQKIIFNDQEYDTLNIFKYKSKEVKNRFVDENITDTNLINNKIAIFQNTNLEVKNNNGWLNNKEEGHQEYNFYGTSYVGPLLVKNPYLLEYFLKKVTKEELTLNKLSIEAYNKRCNC